MPWVVSGDYARQSRPGVVEIGKLVNGSNDSAPATIGGVTISAGQTVVLGNAPPTAGGDTMILTVRAEAVEGGGR